MTGGSAPRRILVGTDGSERAQEAARQAARLASSLGAVLDLVFVIETDQPHTSDVELEAEDALARAGAYAREAGIESDARLLAGDPSEAIVSDAAEHGADLICVGPDAGLLGGSIRIGRVARHVMRNAACSVMLARPSGPAFPRLITCGVDGSEASVATATLAATLAAAAGAELHLLHVVPVFRGKSAEWTLADDEPDPPELGPAVRAAAARGVVPIRDMAMGRPEHALVAAAKRDRVDLLVVGHRAEKGMSRVLLGSVSEHCAEHAPCSVLIARTSPR